MLQALADGTSPNSLKFKRNLLGGLHDGCLERVVAEAKALEQEFVRIKPLGSSHGELPPSLNGHCRSN